MKKILFMTLLLMMVVSVGWATDVTYTVTSTNAVSTSGYAPTGSSATYKSTYGTKFQLTKGNSMVLSLSGFFGQRITKIVLSMRSNASSGSGNLSYSTDGGTNYTYLIGSAISGSTFQTWSGSYTTTYTDVEKTVDITPTSSTFNIKIAATASSLYCKEIKITYEPIPIDVTGVTLNESSLYLVKGSTKQLTASVAPKNATNKNVSWNSSNTDVAIVSNTGLVTAVAVGNTTITVTTENGNKTASCNITVSNEAVSVTSVSINKTETSLYVGDKEILLAIVTPENATNQNVFWTSSDETVASVVDGEITALKVGETTVTVTTEDGSKTATCIVTVNALPTYNIIFSQNGVASAPVSYNRGDLISFPSVTSPEGFVFMGWLTEELPLQQTAPEYINTTAATATANTIYYAVYAVRSKDVFNVTDILTTVTFGTQSSYSNWNNKSATSSAVYAGNSATNNNDNIQIRDNNDSGIVTTSSGGKVKRIVVKWAENTTKGRTLDIYGSNTAYTNSSNLYSNEKKGTKLGSIIYGTSTELNITNDYTYVGIRSNYGSMYLDNISIIWETGSYSYSDYCTRTTTPATFSIAKACTDGTKYYGTYSNNHAFVVPEGLTVSEISVDNAGKLTVTDYSTGDIVPANTGVMVSSNTYGEKSIVLTMAAGRAKTDNNMLKATGDESIDATVMALANSNCKYYRLTMHNGSTIGFYYGAADGAAFLLAANKAYLAVPQANAKEGFAFGETAGISEIEKMRNAENEKVYNLAGQQMKSAVKGVYIKNGKKFIK